MPLVRPPLARRTRLRGPAPAIAGSILLHGAVLLAAVRAPPPRGGPEREALAVQLEDAPPEAPTPPRPPEEPVANHVAAPPPVHVATHAAPAHPAESPATPTPLVPTPAVAPAVMTSDDALPHFTLASVNVASATTSSGLLAAAGTSVAPAADASLYDEGTVDVPARARTKIDPVYPREARAGGVEGDVRLEIVLSTTGAVEDVRPLTHLGHGCELAAAAAARKTSFTPAMKAGHPVRVRMAWTVQFELR